MPQESIKHCKEALSYEKQNPKAYHRMHLAYKQLNDLDRAKESLHKAIEQDSQNRQMRAEWKDLCSEKGKKEKEWYEKMAGFYNGPKLQKIETQDEEEQLLR